MRLERGNTFRLLINGEQFFPRVRQLIEYAKNEVFLETFILADDKVGQDVRRSLMAAAKRGVQVNVTVDGYGSEPLPATFIDGLTACGVQFHVFDPKPRRLGVRTNVFRRLHRKIICIDGEVALLGGINFSAQHLADYGPKAKQDYAIEVRGPLAAEIRSFVSEALVQPGKVGRQWWQLAPAAQTDASRNASMIIRDNDWHHTDIENAYRAGIRAARSDILIANGYFFPGYRLLRDIANAARRGVRTRLILQGEPDMPIARHASRTLYHYLCDAGVEIHEYCARPFHGKVACIDDNWTTIGSSNLDPFSLALNLEANVFVRDQVLTAALRDALEHLLEQYCQPVKTTIGRRGGLRRLWMGVLVFHFLRRFPAWSGLLPAHRPELASMTASEARNPEPHDPE